MLPLATSTEATCYMLPAVCAVITNERPSVIFRGECVRLYMCYSREYEKNREPPVVIYTCS